MSDETNKTEQLIQIYKEDSVEENLRALIHQVQRSGFLVPAMMPPEVDREEIKKMIEESGGKPAKLPEGAKPVPCVLTNDEGQVYFPVYTASHQIPKEPRYDVIMNIPFKACCALALNETLKAEGIVFNPFTDNLVFKKRLLEAIQKNQPAPEGGARQVRMNPAQFQIMMRQRVEFHDLPLRVYKEGVEFIQKLGDGKEKVVEEIFHNAFQNPELYPYQEKDFAVMALNISEELSLIRVDLPEIKVPAQLCYRIYITHNPVNDEIHYFTIERGKGKGERNLGGIDSEGNHEEYGEAPVEGVELQRIMDLLKGTGQTS